MIDMFSRISTFLMFVLSTTIISSVILMTHPVLSSALAQGQQYSFVSKWGSEGVGFGKLRAIRCSNRIRR